MSFVANKKDILVLTPEPADFAAGAQYALVSLPWTFNRMMLNTGSKGQRGRAMNIAKGIVAQEMLRRALEQRGICVRTQRKSYRDEDLFDFRVQIDGEERKIDVKTWNYFTDYNALGRQPLSKSLIINYADYPGPIWTQFFPMLVPHTQIGQDKETYCFAMAQSIDFRNDHTSDRDKFVMAAFPYGPIMPFLSSRKLCQAREEYTKGIRLALEWQKSNLYDPEQLNLSIIGEWDGKGQKAEVKLTQRREVTVGPFSCVSAFQIPAEDHATFGGGTIVSRIKKNDLSLPVFNSARADINEIPEENMTLRSEDFCNLILPNNYTLYVIGWSRKEEFLRGCRAYPAWVWPNDAIDSTRNQEWSQITERDISSITRAGFGDCIQKKPSKIAAGWLKTHGRGGGACCYVYPNIGMNGGVKETNLYVLPKDVRTMDTLR